MPCWRSSRNAAGLPEANALASLSSLRREVRCVGVVDGDPDGRGGQRRVRRGARGRDARAGLGEGGLDLEGEVGVVAATEDEGAAQRRLRRA